MIDEQSPFAELNCWSRDYGDAAGRRTHISSHAGSFDVGYCEWNGKLAAITNANGFVVEYAYDIMDRVTNISWRTTSGATLGGFEYAYDFAGNVTRIERDGRPTLDLTWNSQYQLVSVATNGVFAEGYEYDALGRRVLTTTLEGTTRHVYDDNWQVIADLDEDGDVVASYTWGDGDEFVTVPVLANIRYRFQCREWSAATGLVNFRMRWYDSGTGRWLSKDPIGLCGGLNLYSFCGDVPLRFRDAFGLCKNPESEKDIIKAKELFTGGNFWLDAYLGCQLHGAGGSMDYAAIDHSSKWKFPSGEIRNSNQMGNYMAGYDAGYSESPLLLYAGVRGGGMLFGALGGVEGWRDSGSVPDINAGFSDGVVEKAIDDAMSDPFVQTIFAVIDLFK